MIKVAITPENIFVNEPVSIATILDAGWDYVHLRHPQLSIEEMRNLLARIPYCYHDRLKLHDNFELVEEFAVGGLHLNSRNPLPPVAYTGKLSKSCHCVDDTLHCGRFEYVTLSPVFDSVSKKDYKKAFTHDELNALPQGKVVALGGITAERLELLGNYPFVGFAMLGYLFETHDIKDLRLRLDLIKTKLK